VKADVGVKDGKIVGIGKAGNPSTMEGVSPGLAVGPATDAISAEHLILTPAGMDAHVHMICPQQVQAVDPAFIAATGLQASLTPSRANGFLNILRMMQAQARQLETGSDPSTS